jgi:hypothetical protein
MQWREADRAAAVVVKHDPRLYNGVAHPATRYCTHMQHKLYYEHVLNMFCVLFIGRAQGWAISWPAHGHSYLHNTPADRARL